jgi:monoamine oxidase
VVGGGLAGLRAARAVAAAGRTVAVLEARADRVGGRLESRTHDGFAFDLGATWIGAGHDRAGALVDQLGLRLRRTHSEGAAVIVHERAAPRRETRRPRDRLRELEQRLAERRLDRLARRVPAGAPWDAARASALDGQTLEAWLRRSALTRRSRTELRLVLTNVLAAEPEEVSLLHALHYLGANRGLSAVLNIAGGAQEQVLEGGAQALARGMDAELGDAVELGAAVRRVAQCGEGVRVESDAVSVDASVAVVASWPPRWRPVT